MLPKVRTVEAEPSIEELIENVGGYFSESDLHLIEEAYEFAAAAHSDQMRSSGRPFIEHSLAAAKILVDMRMDPQAVAAALLHDVVEDTDVTLEDLRRHFGEEIANLVDGVTKLSRIEWDTFEEEEAESLRKMFLAMAEDIRVVLIKLSDRLHNMRTLWALPPEKRMRIAQETLDIFAPLASRLGIWQIKWELEDLCLKYLQPEQYRETRQLLAERRSERERYIAKVIDILDENLAEEGIAAQLSGRSKHIYSIYQKMRRKGIDFDQIYDTNAVRIIVDEVKDCYAALGVVHALWKPIPGEFDDYIATPKENLYQSLHTALIGPEGKPLEVQIRTHEMHQVAEYGIAAHWSYKEGKTTHDEALKQKIAWLRQLMEWRRELADAREFIDSLKTDVFQDQVYVFTPQGDIIDLPRGATPIDFAYRIHTEVGHLCRGAKVNGRMVSLDYELATGDQVEILTAKRGGPSRDWLIPHLGYVKTSRAREKIRRWFRQQRRDKAISQGRSTLEKELKRLDVEEMSFGEVASFFDYDNLEDFLAAIGYGDVHTQQIATEILEAEREEEPPVKFTAPPLEMPDIRVSGVGDLLTRLAGCCNPLPGDPIIGYVTRGRGVTVHRQDCSNVLSRNGNDRLIEVEWGQEAEDSYPVMVKVVAFDRSGLMQDFSSVVASEGVNMASASAATDKKEGTATITATLEITDAAQLARILTKAERLPNVIGARRQTN